MNWPLTAVFVGETIVVVALLTAYVAARKGSPLSRGSGRETTPVNGRTLDDQRRHVGDIRH